jgi:hypothetical protein
MAEVSTLPDPCPIPDKEQKVRKQSKTPVSQSMKHNPHRVFSFKDVEEERFTTVCPIVECGCSLI